MTDKEKFRDPCNDLDQVTKEQRIFRTEHGDLVCQVDPEEKKYHTLTLLDENRTPIAINHGFLHKLKQKQKTEE